MEFSGQYLTYPEYKSLGGTLDIMPFNLLEFEARKKIDNRTLYRLKNVEEISNWKELGLKEKSYIRIEIPQRIEPSQLIGKITEIPKEQFIKYYKLMIDIFNIDIIEKMMNTEKELVSNKWVNRGWY